MEESVTTSTTPTLDYSKPRSQLAPLTAKKPKPLTATELEATKKSLRGLIALLKPSIMQATHAAITQTNLPLLQANIIGLINKYPATNRATAYFTSRLMGIDEMHQILDNVAHLINDDLVNTLCDDPEFVSQLPHLQQFLGNFLAGLISGKIDKHFLSNISSSSGDIAFVKKFIGILRNVLLQKLQNPDWVDTILPDKMVLKIGTKLFLKNGIDTTLINGIFDTLEEQLLSAVDPEVIAYKKLLAGFNRELALLINPRKSWFQQITSDWQHWINQNPRDEIQRRQQRNKVLGLHQELIIRAKQFVDYAKDRCSKLDALHTGVYQQKLASIANKISNDIPLSNDDYQFLKGLDIIGHGDTPVPNTILQSKITATIAQFTLSEDHKIELVAESTHLKALTQDASQMIRGAEADKYCIKVGNREQLSDLLQRMKAHEEALDAYISAKEKRRSDYSNGTLTLLEKIDAFRRYERNYIKKGQAEIDKLQMARELRDNLSTTVRLLSTLKSGPTPPESSTTEIAPITETVSKLATLASKHYGLLRSASSSLKNISVDIQAAIQDSCLLDNPGLVQSPIGMI